MEGIYRVTTVWIITYSCEPDCFPLLPLEKLNLEKFLKLS